MVHLLLLTCSASSRIVSERRTFDEVKLWNRRCRRHKFLFIAYLLTECTCSFHVPSADEALVEVFSRGLQSQLLPMKPDQQHSVPMLLIAVLTCR